MAVVEHVFVNVAGATDGLNVQGYTAPPQRLWRNW